MEDQYTVVAQGGDVTEQPVSSEATVETTEAQETQTQATEPTEEQKQHQRKGGWQRKIEKLERELEVWRDEALKHREAPKQESKPAAESSDDPKPKLDNFADYEEYTLALARWGARQEFRDRETKVKESAKAEEERQQQKIVKEKWDAAVDAARDAHDDFDDVAFNPKVTKLVTPVIAEAVMTSDIAAELAYWLGQHPDEVERIAKLSPTAAVREIGKLEVRIAPPEQKEELKAPPVTKAPKPPTPVSKPSAAKAFDINDPKVSWSDWKKARESELKRK